MSNFLKNFFTAVRFEDYIVRPHHMFYAVIIMAGGWKCILTKDWETFGVIVFIIGVLFSGVIMLGISWRGPIAYWERIEQAVNALNRIKDPAVWTALGFKRIPEVATVIEKRYDDKGIFTGLSKIKVPVNPSMMNMIANEVLMSGSLDFTEEKYKSKIKNFRSVKKDFKEKGYVAPINKNNVKLGYVWTKKGIDVIYEYADITVIELVNKRLKEEGERSGIKK